MPKINVYLPDDLAAAVKAAGIPVSSVCQHALADAVAAAGEPSATESNPDRLTDRARTAIASARSAAGDGEPTTVDLFDGLIAEGTNLAISVLTALDIEVADVADEVHAMARRHPAGPMEVVLSRAVHEAHGLGHNFVGCEHLLIALAAGPPDELVAATLTRMGADANALRGAVRAALAGWAHARDVLTLSGLSAPIRAALDDIRQRLSRIEKL